MAIPVTGSYRVQVVPVPPQNGVATQTGEMQPVLETVSTSSRPELAVPRRRMTLKINADVILLQIVLNNCHQ